MPSRVVSGLGGRGGQVTLQSRVGGAVDEDASGAGQCVRGSEAGSPV